MFCRVFKSEEIAILLFDKWMKIAESGNLMHSYIVYGSNESDRINFIYEFVSRVIFRDDKKRSISLILKMLKDNNYADFHFFNPAGEHDFLTSQIEDVQGVISRAPIEKSYKFIIINKADRMNQVAQNRLLKTLEEPHGKTIIFLLTDKIELLRQTIRSRCSNMYLGEAVLLDRNEEIDELVDNLRESKFFYKSKNMLLTQLKNYEDAYGLLQSIEDNLRMRLYDGEDPNQLLSEIAAVIEARKSLSRNISIGNVFGVMILKFGGFDD